MHLLLTPFLAGVVLVEAGQITVIALVQGLIAHDRNAGLAHFGKREIERALRPLQRRCVGDIESDTLRLQLAAGFFRFIDPCSVNSTSRQPVNRFFRFHSLWP